MNQSINKKVDLTIDGTSFLGGGSYGKVIIGDVGFEFFNERTARDFIQIPWNEVDIVPVSIVFGRWIPRFAIKTKSSGTFAFSTKEPKKTLRAIREYVAPDKIVKSLGFGDMIKNGIKGIFKRK